MAIRALPSQEVLRQLLDYDPQTGALTWRERPVESFSGKRRVAVAKCWNARFAGQPALNIEHGNGYFSGSIGKVRVYAHRAAWKLATGDDPEFVDHINGNRQDNRLANLRSVTRAENAKNKCTPRTNTSGYVGVSFCKQDQRWEAYIGDGVTRARLGKFVHIGDAIAARKNAEARHGYHENHGRTHAHH